MTYTYLEAIQFLTDTLSARGTELEIKAIDRILEEAEKNALSSWDKEETSKIRISLEYAKKDLNIT